MTIFTKLFAGIFLTSLTAAAYSLTLDTYNKTTQDVTNYKVVRTSAADGDGSRILKRNLPGGRIQTLTLNKNGSKKASTVFKQEDGTWMQSSISTYKNTPKGVLISSDNTFFNRDGKVIAQSTSTYTAKGALKTSYITYANNNRAIQTFAKDGSSVLVVQYPNGTMNTTPISASGVKGAVVSSRLTATTFNTQFRKYVPATSNTNLNNSIDAVINQQTPRSKKKSDSFVGTKTITTSNRNGNVASTNDTNNLQKQRSNTAPSKFLTEDIK